MIICVNNNKGGSLKTTATTNFAGVLAKKGKKVLIVDADNQSNVALTFGINPDELRTTLYDVLVDGLIAEDAIINVHKNIDILPSNSSMIGFEFNVLRNMDKYPDPFALMKQQLSHLRKQYDYILVDTPPSLGVMNGNVFAFADHVLIPFVPEKYSMRSLVEVIKQIRMFKEVNPKLNILGVIPVMVNSQTNLHSDVLQETNRFSYEQGFHIFETEVPRSVQYAKAVAYEELPSTLAKKRVYKEWSEVYYKLWEEIEELLKGSAVL